MKTLRISATAHGVNYLPEYYARENGIFSRHGLDVTATARDPWDGVLADLADGSADVALGGLWVPAMYAGMGRDLVAFGQLNDRFPMAVVTRDPVPDFEWSWMTGKTVLVPGQGGTAPYEFTSGLMREVGVDPSRTRFARDLSTPMLRELFVAGLGDAFVADLGTACDLRLAGVGHLACQLAEVGGRMPNSVYYVLRERLDELAPRLVAFLAAIDEAMAELRASDVDAVAPLLDKEWPDANSASLQAATKLLIANGTWAGVRIDQQPCDRWTSILHTAGLTVSQAPYESIVDTRAMDALRG